MLKCPCGFSVYEGCDEHFPETPQRVRNLNLIERPRLKKSERRQPGDEPTPCPRCGSMMPRGCDCEWE